MGKEEEYGWQCHILGLITYCPASRALPSAARACISERSLHCVVFMCPAHRLSLYGWGFSTRNDFTGLGVYRPGRPVSLSAN
jgi:hypothetical protein